METRQADAGHMAEPGVEVVLRAHRDPALGAFVSCGTGGIGSEIFNDVVLRLVPLGLQDAESMIEELCGRRLLAGKDRAAIVDALMRLSELMLARADIVSIDIDPAVVYASGLRAVSARVQLVQTASNVATKQASFR